MKNNKNKKNIKRRFVTLIEMMIVMFLIALITGVVAYNYRGSLDEGKAFKTKAGIEKLETILSLALAEDQTKSLSAWQEVIKSSPLVKDPDAVMKDGWGNIYDVKEEDGKIVISSQKYNEYQIKNPGSMFTQ